MDTTMQGKELFEAHAAEWASDRGVDSPAGAPLEIAVAIGKRQIISDLRGGIVPHNVKSFSELHDHVDANYYGDAFDWPTMAADADDDDYQIAHSQFWNTVQSRLNDWITSGEMVQAFRNG